MGINYNLTSLNTPESLERSGLEIIKQKHKFQLEEIV